jgi:hypothetical protein
VDPGLLTLKVVRHHSMAKRDVRREAHQALIEMGVMRPLPPGEIPRVVLESVFVQTKGGTMRCCLDAVPVNKKTVVLPMTAVNMDSIFESVQRPEEAAYNVVVDHSKAFHTMVLSETAQQLLIERSEDGFVQYIRAAFGPTNCPAEYQAATNAMFADRPSAMKRYVDESWIRGASPLACLKVLSYLFQRMIDCQCPAKGSSMQFFNSSTVFLGRVIRSGSLYPRDDHLHALLNYPNPGNNPKLIRCLIGMAAWQNRFIPAVAVLLQPFSEMLRKDSLESYDSSKHDAALQLLQKFLRERIIGNRFIDRSKPIIMEGDACDTGLGLALLQPIQTQDYSKGYVINAVHSQLFNATQRKWAIIEKEAFVIIRGISYWGDLIYGMQVIFRTDHRPLRWIFRVVSSGLGNARVTRWHIALMGWSLTVEWIPGSQNALADVLSRYVVFTHPLYGQIATDKRVAEEPIAMVAKALVFRQQAGEIIDSVDSVSAGVLPVRRNDGDRLNDQDDTGQHEAPMEFSDESIVSDVFIAVSLKNLGSHIQIDLSKFTDAEVRGAKALFRAHEANLMLGFGKTRLFYRGGKDHHSRIVLPKRLCRSVFDLYHSGWHGGHPAFEKTFERLALFCWWPDMEADVRHWCQVCHSCQVSKKGGSTLDLTRGQRFPVTYPMQKIFMDFSGPYAVTDRGNRFVITVTDNSTRYRVGESVPDKSAVTVARFLVFRVILQFGAPIIIETDEDKAFINSLISRLCDLLMISQQSTFPYNPQGVSIEERAHNEVHTIMRSLQVDEDKWDLALPWVIWMVNNRVNKSIGMTPFRAMFGREALSPLNAGVMAEMLKYLAPEDAGLLGLPIQEWVRQLHDDVKLREAAHRVMVESDNRRFSQEAWKRHS